MSVERRRNRRHTCVPSETRHWLLRDTLGPAPSSTAPRHDRRPGRIVAGRYRLERLLGTGGMGDVWLATDEVLARPVAIKEFTLGEEVLDSASASTRVLREAQAAAQVSHPGIVRIHDLAAHDGRLWIVMEPLSGPTLAQAIRQHGRMDPARVLEIAVQLLAALDALHRAGVVHRDVKPSNVQLSANDRVVLIDFGLAARDGKAAPIKRGQIVGSPPFMAPESIESGRFGPASDLFSLGATLYAAVEGRQLFDAMSAFSTLEAVKNETVPPAQHAGCLRPLIDALLSRDPDARPSVSEAQSYLEAVQGARSNATSPDWQPAYG
jgi:serine/threonine protein kinase